jgi:hypothetical protein
MFLECNPSQPERSLSATTSILEDIDRHENMIIIMRMNTFIAGNAQTRCLRIKN